MSLDEGETERRDICGTKDMPDAAVGLGARLGRTGASLTLFVSGEFSSQQPPSAGLIMSLAMRPNSF